MVFWPQILTLGKIYHCNKENSVNEKTFQERESTILSIKEKLERRNGGTEEQRNRGTEEQRNRGSEDQRIRGSEDQRIRGSEDQKIRGTGKSC